MLKVNKVNLVVGVVLIITVFLWVQVNQNPQKKPDYPLTPRIKLSALPDDINNSLETISQRIKKSNTNNNKFQLNFKNLLHRDITEDTPLVLQTYYEGSQEISEMITEMPPSFVGLNLNQLSQYLDEWSIKKFEQGRALVIYRSKSGLSPEDKEKQYLGIKDGQVAIFYGKKGSGVLKQKTSILVDNLPEKERKSLQEGIEINSREELLTILEGLASLNQD